ncbi:MAG TPA: response regulator transcription factor [Edaphobacter sp.]|jgi:DNA-binding NarL/FixJ family response regulator|nr:response regulator transcription factor [Edaphobacter sp.]
MVSSQRWHGVAVIRVLIVEDQALVCEGLEMLLNLVEDIRVAGRAADGIEALRSMQEQAPDLVLLDVRMPKMSGIEVLREMKANALMIPAILLTTFDDDAALLEGIRLGAKGYLLKDVSLAKLTEAIRLVAAGRSMISPVVTERLLHGLREAPLPPDSGYESEALTVREAEIIRLMTGGYSNREIAGALYLSEGTVKNHVSNILSKLGVRDRTRAVLKAIEKGIV